ncbi:CDGSH iron-sulfur domain-containing protein [uncultured Litoreibacter sp.]|uniref:CDGSH iron-sulfur domain-containing protein n=1 Tax=uncultured Litoreibacter sp. TaxID=1392394 RepID=UPI00260FFAA9|nr:CDGSH iron-sulfur domain-containing protein [uncultured Litoreibacter sp.]
MSKPTITERDNGPLVVEGVTSMTDHRGNAIAVKPVMALCRCGKSANKPFCDGAHNDGFDGSREDVTGRDKIYTYTHDGKTVHFSKLLCSHAGECVRRSVAMFNPKRRPWVMLENGTKSQIEEIVQACPSGALRISEEGGEPHHLYGDGVEIRVEKNGAYWVKEADLENPKPMQGATEKKFVLCRCGKSSNKPYCDGTHYEESWREND